MLIIKNNNAAYIKLSKNIPIKMIDNLEIKSRTVFT